MKEKTKFYLIIRLDEPSENDKNEGVLYFVQFSVGPLWLSTSPDAFGGCASWYPDGFRWSKRFHYICCNVLSCFIYYNSPYCS